MCFLPEISHSFQKIWDKIFFLYKKNPLESINQEVAVYPYQNFRWCFPNDYDLANPSKKFEATNKYNQLLE